MTYCIYISRQDGPNDPPRSPIAKEELDSFVAANRNFKWISENDPGAENVPGARGYTISWKGDPCIQGDGLTLGVAEADDELTIELVRITRALDANAFDGDNRLELQKGFLGKDKIVSVPMGRSR